MELWIRSQDKRTVLKANRIDVDDTDIICWDNDYRCSETYMGKYKTQKRALEILDEIQKILEPQKTIKTIDNTVKIENAIHIVNPTYETITQFDTYVYEMPEE